MKARVKTTGEIVEVKSKVITSFTGKHKLKYINQKSGVSYFEEELFFPKDLELDTDYWTRLEHQYAGMAMQQLVHLVNVGYEYVYEETAIIAMNFAHALVEKLKEEEKK